MVSGFHRHRPWRVILSRCLFFPGLTPTCLGSLSSSQGSFLAKAHACWHRLSVTRPLQYRWYHQTIFSWPFGGQIIVRNNLKDSGGCLICLFCLVLFCCGVERVGKCVIKPDSLSGLLADWFLSFYCQQRDKTRNYVAVGELTAICRQCSATITL